MRFASLAPIRVDQSHCNYHLARWLRDQQWRVLFTDPGRVSRGGSGTQGACLRIFEEQALPIPDIVASRDGTLLIIEIDSNYARVAKSLSTYKEHKRLLGEKLTEQLAPQESVIFLWTAFCRTGVYAGSLSTLGYMNSPEVDLLFAFREPRVPSVIFPKNGFAGI